MSDALLGLQFLDQRHNLFQRRDAILVAMDEQAGRGAGRKKAVIEAVGGRRDRDEALDLRPAHQKLHADPGAKRDAGDPAGARLRADRLRPVEGGGGVRQFALTVVESALRPSNAAEVETQHGKPAFGETIISVVDNLIVHRPAKLRVRMKHHRDRRPALLGGMKATLQPTGGTGKENLGHEHSTIALKHPRSGVDCARRRLAARNQARNLSRSVDGGSPRRPPHSTHAAGNCKEKPQVSPQFTPLTRESEP